MEDWFNEYKVMQKRFQNNHLIWKWFIKEYVDNGVDPLIFRGPSDSVRISKGLGDIGHFTAMVTAKTTKLGCGKIRDKRLEMRVTYVCNYSPPGNVMMRFRKTGKIQAMPAYEVEKEELLFNTLDIFKSSSSDFFSGYSVRATPQNAMSQSSRVSRSNRNQPQLRRRQHHQLANLNLFHPPPPSKRRLLLLPLWWCLKWRKRRLHF